MAVWIVTDAVGCKSLRKDCAGGAAICTRAERIAGFDIVQENAASEAEAWPLVLDVLLLGEDGRGSSERFAVDGHRVTITGLEGREAPAAVLLNSSDVAYGQFLVDDASANWLREHLGEIEDPLVQQVRYLDKLIDELAKGKPLEKILR